MEVRKIVSRFTRRLTLNLSPSLYRSSAGITGLGLQGTESGNQTTRCLKTLKPLLQNQGNTAQPLWPPSGHTEALHWETQEEKREIHHSLRRGS